MIRESGLCGALRAPHNLISPIAEAIYNPTLGDDQRNFLGIEPAIARQNLQRMNRVIQTIANHHGIFVDLHAHFLKGDPTWFTATIEPSLKGVSEVRRAFLLNVIQHGAA